MEDIFFYTIKYLKKEKELTLKNRITYLQYVIRDIKENLNLENVRFIIFTTNQNKPMISIKIIDNFLTSRIYLKKILIYTMCIKHSLYYSETDKKASDFYIFFQYI
jgi:hypothetical protein